MGKQTQIPWADSTWGPWRGCNPVSPGCDNCYAAAFAKRYPKLFPGGFNTLTRSKTTFEDPLKWPPRVIFPCSLSDFLHPGADEWREEAWHIIRHTPHTYLILTKRPERFEEVLAKVDGWPLPNVWLGVTVENQEMADKRIPLLFGDGLGQPGRASLAAGHFLSCEPLLGPLDLHSLLVESYNPLYEIQAQRRSHLRSGEVGAADDRRPGADLESGGTAWQSVGQGPNSTQSSPPPCRARHGRLPTGAPDGEQKEDVCSRTPTGLEALSRIDSGGLDGQSQERQKEGQYTDEFGVGHPSRADTARHDRVGQIPTDTEPKRRKESRIKTPRSRNKGNEGTEGARGDSTGTGAGLRGGVSDNLKNLSGRLLGTCDLIIIGGESGPSARPMPYHWVYEILSQCRSWAIPAFVKQMSQVEGRGFKDPATWPAALRVQELPEALR